MSNKIIKLCSHDQLLELDQTKSYTAMSNEVMYLVLKQPQLSSAIRLWLYIRIKQSGFKDRAFVCLTVNKISEDLSVSRATIQNWQRILVESGFLEIKMRKLERKNNLPNLYRAAVPLADYKQLRNKTRRKGEGSRVGQRNLVQTQNERRGTEPKQMVDVCSDLNLIVGSNTTLPCQSNSQEEVKEALLKLNIPNWLKLMIHGVKLWLNETGDLVIKDLPDHAKKPLLEALDKQKMEHSKFSGQVKLLSERETRRVPETKMRRLEKNTNKKPYLDNHCNHTQQKILLRLMNMETFAQAQPSNKDIEALSQEIYFAITQGSLSNFNLLHGLNIAIKLVKENRWQKPFLYSTSKYSTPGA